MKAYVLFEMKVGSVQPSIEALRRLGYDNTCGVTGPYDAIAVVNGRDMTEIGNVITGKFHKIPGITRTVTCFVTDISERIL